MGKGYGVHAPRLGTRRSVIVVDEDGRIAHGDVATVGLGYQSVDDLAGILESL